MKKLLAVILVSGLVFLFVGCKKKEEKPLLPPGHPSMEGGMPAGMSASMPKIDRTVTVPKEVSAKWSAVKLAVEDKVTKSKKEYTVTVGSELAVPNTKVKIKVLAFLPDFKMVDKEITSLTAKPNNPAVQVTVNEPGKEEWKGWLYSMHPEIHPFPHDKLAVTLVGGVSK
jgi:muconolactone delta-isomerase